MYLLIHIGSISDSDNPSTLTINSLFSLSPDKSHILYRWKKKHPFWLIQNLDKYMDKEEEDRLTTEKNYLLSFCLGFLEFVWNVIIFTSGLGFLGFLGSGFFLDIILFDMLLALNHLLRSSNNCKHN